MRRVQMRDLDSLVANRYRLDDNGNPVPMQTFDEYVQWVESEYRTKIVKRDRLQVQGDGILVSTVFLCLDHNYGDGPPVLWETMIFGGPHDRYQERYSSREDAIAGHARVVELAKTPGGKNGKT